MEFLINSRQFDDENAESDTDTDIDIAIGTEPLQSVLMTF